MLLKTGTKRRALRSEMRSIMACLATSKPWRILRLLELQARRAAIIWWARECRPKRPSCKLNRPKLCEE